MAGWVKLHRSLTEWEWYSDINVSRLFVHLLLKANHEDKSWQGKMIKRGQTVTGRAKLSEETGLSEKQIRTALDKLKSTGEVAIESASKFSVITICKYADYQQDDRDKGPAEGPAFGQAEGQQRATNKNEKNEKKKETQTRAEKFNHELLKPVCVSDDLWSQFIANRTFKKLSNTSVALKTIMNAFSHGIPQFTYSQMIEEYISTKWQRFDPSWMSKSGDVIAKQTTKGPCSECSNNWKPACKSATESQRNGCTHFEMEKVAA